MSRRLYALFLLLPVGYATGVALALVARKRSTGHLRRPR